MRRILPPAVVTAVLTCAGLMAQSTAPTTPQNVPAQSPTTQAPMPVPSGSQQAAAANQPRIAPGSVIPVQLTKTVDAKKAKTGDEVVAKVTMDMKTQAGQVLVPKDTKVIGHVTEAQARHKDEKESQLGLSFNQAVLNNQQVQLPMSIQAVVGQENNDNGNAGAGSGPSGASPSPSSTGTGASSPMGGRSPNAGGGETQPPTTPPTATIKLHRAAPNVLQSMRRHRA